MAKLPALPSTDKAREVLEWVVWVAHIVGVMATIVRDGARTLATQGMGWELPPLSRTDREGGST